MITLSSAPRIKPTGAALDNIPDRRLAAVKLQGNGGIG